MGSFHCHLDELERAAQNSQRMKELLVADGILCYAAYVGSNPVVETLIQKGVGKEKMYLMVENYMGHSISNQHKRIVTPTDLNETWFLHSDC